MCERDGEREGEGGRGGAGGCPLVPCSRDVHMRLQHQVSHTHVIFTTVFKERDLRGEVERERDRQTDRQTDRQAGRQAGRQAALLTDFLTVVGQPSSNTGPLSVLLILNRREKLIGRM